MSSDTTPHNELAAADDAPRGAPRDVVGEVVSGGIRPFRNMRGSAPISAELFTSTSDPLVIAFQTSAMFATVHDPDLTLAVLQQRWTASRRGAAAARRALVELGYWVGVRVRVEGGQWRTETRTSEVRMTEADLADLAAQYTPTSQLECGGRTYVVGLDGSLRVTAGGNSARPAETLDAAPAELPLAVTRSDQAIVDNSLTELPPAVTRADQGEHQGSAGRAELPLAVVPHTYISSSSGNTCMHDDLHEEFWAILGKLRQVPIDRGGRKARHEQIAVAFQAGWTPDTLASWVAAQVAGAKRLSNPAGFIIATLREIPAPAEVPPTPRQVAVQRAAEARRDVELRARERDACALCDDDGLVEGRKCNHDPARAQSPDVRAAARARLADALAGRRGTAGSGGPAAPPEPQQGERAAQ